MNSRTLTVRTSQQAFVLNISAKVEYACIAVLELAASYGSGQPERVGRIAETHGIPARFLVQILLQLKGAGLVNSTRGAAGGYQLVKDPAEITLGEVMSLIEGQPWALTRAAGIATPTTRVLFETWQDVADVQREMLSGITFADLAERARGLSQNMYYI
jgi:Rrf2 family protein